MAEREGRHRERMGGRVAGGEGDRGGDAEISKRQ